MSCGRRNECPADSTVNVLRTALYSGVAMSFFERECRRVIFMESLSVAERALHKVTGHSTRYRAKCFFSCTSVHRLQRGAFSRTPAGGARLLHASTTTATPIAPPAGAPAGQAINLASTM